MPNETSMRILDSMRSRWAIELVFAREDRTLPDRILLTVYNGGIEEWRGRWHIPGGYGTIEPHRRFIEQFLDYSA